MSRELRDLLETTQRENQTLRKRVDEARVEIERLTALLEASRLENDRLAGLWVKQHLNPDDQQPAFDVQRVVEYLKRGQ